MIEIDIYHNTFGTEPNQEDSHLEPGNEPSVLADKDILHQLEKIGQYTVRQPELDEVEVNEFFIHNCDIVLDRSYSSVRIEPTYRDELIEPENEPDVVADEDSLRQLEKNGWDIDRHNKLDQTDSHTHNNKPVNNQQGYVNYIISAHEAIRRSGKPNFRRCKVPVRSNLNISFLENELVNYHEKDILNFFRYG